MKVILIDDEIWIREGLKVQIPWSELGLVMAGEASTGTEGLALVEKVKPDIILTDIAMPELGGLDLLEIINRTYPQIVTIVISGYAEFNYARQALIHNAFDYLLKPFDDETLAATMARAKQQAIALRNEKAGRQLTEPLPADLGAEEIEAALLRAYPSLRLTYPVQFTVVQWSSKHSHEFEAEIADCIERIRVGSIPLLLLHNKDSFRLVAVHPVSAPIQESERLFENKTFQVGIGARVTRRSELKTSYEQALRSLEYCGWLGDLSTISYEHIHKRAQILVLNDEFIHDFIARLESDGINQLLPWFYSWLDRQLDNSLYTLASIRKAILELMVIISRRYRKTNEPVSSLFDQSVSIPANSVSRSDFKERFRRLIEQVIALLNQGKSTKRTIEAIKEYMDDNYAEEINLKSVAQLFFLNPAYLSRLFKQEYGKNFNEYIFHLKMKKAEKLLADKSLKIELISEMCGFESTKYFFKRFKLYFGCTPSEYRKTKLQHAADYTDK